MNRRYDIQPLYDTTPDGKTVVLFRAYFVRRAPFPEPLTP